MKTVKIWMFVLMLLFTALMSVPFLIPNAGPAILFGFIPLLFMDVLADAKGIRHFFWWYYGAFLLWNAATTFWVCNATVGGGIFASAANALQMALLFAVYRLSKKRFGPVLSHIFLAVMWIAWERFYFSAEISWPWLTLGNAFAGTTKLIQWYEYTGSLGGSLWVWACNLCLFYLLLFVLGGHFKDLRWFGKICLPAACIILLAAPAALSLRIYDNYNEDKSKSVDVLIAQPNFDPYQKFQSMSQEQQDSVLLDLFAKELDAPGRRSMPQLLLAPETFTSGIMLNSVRYSDSFNRFADFVGNYPGMNLIFGASAYEYIFSEDPPTYTARKVGDGMWAESHNVAFSLDSDNRYDFYLKSRLVVGTEKMPYPRIFAPIDDKLGGVMGRCVGQDEPHLLYVNYYDSEGRLTDYVGLGCAICYESVYGEYCTGYVQKGARFLTVITNDAWWGDTPGYKQHLNYSRLRAIETRRDIARCGNTGISAFIDQKGDILSASHWWKRETLEGKVYLNDKMTFFVRHGDIVGRVCTYAFLLGLLALLVLLAIRRK